MIRDVITVGSKMQISLLYRGEYSQWRERFLNYLEEKMDGEVMIHSITHGLPNGIYSLIDSNDTAQELWDALERQMCGSEYGEQDRKAVILYEYETFKATKGDQLLDTYIQWKQYGTLMRQTKNLMDINIDALYNILKQNQGDVNEAMGNKMKAVVATLDPLALVAEKTKVSKSREKVVVQSESKGSDDEDISELKKIIALLAKAFNRKKYYAKPTNNNLRTFCFFFSKQETRVKDYNYYKTKMLLAKKDGDEQVILAEDQAWMESSSDLDQEISANMVFMAIMEKVLSDSEESSSSAEETITEIFPRTVRFSSKDFAVIAGYEDVIIGLMMIKKEKIHRKHPKSKTDFASNKPLYLLHIDLCVPMSFKSINRKRYVLVVVDDYSQYTWVFFLHSKDEASEVIISFIKKTQVNLQLQVQRVRTDNGTAFTNKTLANFFDEMLLLNDYDDVGKLNAKGDIGVFVGYLKESDVFRIYNKRT
ncbi:ribonuclease H-like domain-containing protein [Tanacetum coccineum]